MNDFLEIHWGYSIWEKAANSIFNEVDEEFLTKVDDVIRTAQTNGNVLATCFSQNGDTLSQWRAYAGDGYGYSIGFDAKDVVQLQVRPLRILYNEKRQIKEFAAILRAIYEVENQEGNLDKYGANFLEACVALAFDFAAIKNPAFSEEKEIRIIHVLNFIKSNQFLKLVDVGGTAFGSPILGQEVNFRMAGSLPVPYIDIDFTNIGKVNPIKKVILGPKNDSNLSAVSVFLETLNIGNVELEKSSASYR